MLDAQGRFGNLYTMKIFIRQDREIEITDYNYMYIHNNLH